MTITARAPADGLFGQHERLHRLLTSISLDHYGTRLEKIKNKKTKQRDVVTILQGQSRCD